MSKPSPTVRTPPLPAELPLPAPTRTRSPEERKGPQEEREPAATSPPVPAGIHGYDTQPRTFYRQGSRRQGQLVVFLSSIVSEELGPQNVVVEFEGRAAAGIALKGVGLFEAQDLLVNFEVTAGAPVGRYDARIRIGKEEFFLPNVFEVRSFP